MTKRSLFMVIPVVLLLPALIIALIRLLGNVDDSTIQKSLAVALAVVNLLPFAFNLYNRKFSFLTPFFVTLLTYFALFPLRAIYILWANDYDFINGINANPGFISQVLVFLILVLLCYYAAYYISSGTKWSRRVAAADNNLMAEGNLKIVGMAACLYLVFGIAGFFYLVKRLGGLDLGKNTDFVTAGISPYIYESINMLIPSVFLFYIYLKQRKKSELPFHLAALFLTVFYTLCGGRVRVALFLVAYVIMVFYFHRIRAGWLLMCGLLTMFIFYISLVSMNRENWSLASHDKVTFNMSSVSKNFISSQGDMNIFDTFLLIYEKVPDTLHYEYGETIVSLAIQPVPRTVFPQKPALISKTIMKQLMPDWDAKGIGFAGSILADFLINFGKGGVLICIFLWGLASREVEVLLKAKNPLLILICGVTVGSVPLYVRGEFVLISEGYLVISIPVFIVLFLTARRHRIKQRVRSRLS